MCAWVGAGHRGMRVISKHGIFEFISRCLYVYIEWLVLEEIWSKPCSCLVIALCKLGRGWMWYTFLFMPSSIPRLPSHVSVCRYYMMRYTRANVLFIELRSSRYISLLVGFVTRLFLSLHYQIRYMLRLCNFSTAAGVQQGGSSRCCSWDQIVVTIINSSSSF